MGLSVQTILSILAGLIVASFAAMLFDPFFAEFLKGLGIDTSPFGRVVAMLVSQLWFQFVLVALVGAAIGAWLHWAAIKFDASKARLMAVSYTLEQRDCRWYIVFHNEGDGATFGAVLSLNNFEEWQAAPVGSVFGTWNLNTEATQWKGVMKGERAALPLCECKQQIALYFFEKDRFGICMKESEELREEEIVVV